MTMTAAVFIVEL